MSRHVVVFALVAMLVQVSGCARFGQVTSQVPPDLASPLAGCPQDGGVLGMRLEPKTKFRNATFGDWPVVLTRHMEAALMETGCFAAVRNRRTLSLRGHHVDLTVTIQAAGTRNAFISFPLFLLSGTLIPLPTYRTWDNHLEYYYNGELVEEFRWRDDTSNYIGFLSGFVPSSMNDTEFSRYEAERLARIFANVVEAEEPAK